MDDRELEKWAFESLKSVGFLETQERAKKLWHETGFDGYLAVEMALARLRGKFIWAKQPAYGGVFKKFLILSDARIKLYTSGELVVNLEDFLGQESEPFYLGELYLILKWLIKNKRETYEKLEKKISQNYILELLNTEDYLPPPADTISLKLLALYHCSLNKLPQAQKLREELKVY